MVPKKAQRILWFKMEMDIHERVRNLILNFLTKTIKK